VSTEKPITITHRARPVGVFARRIVAIPGNAPGGALNLTLEDGSPFTAGPEMTARYFPLIGDYLVVSQDGYAYLNPAEVFEAKYERNATDFESRFAVDDTVLFQPRVELVGTLREYEHTVLAKVFRARLIGNFVHYDLVLRSEDAGGGEAWNAIDGVPSIMVLPLPNRLSAPAEVDHDAARVRSQALMAALQAVSKDGPENVLEAARSFERFLQGGGAEAAPDNMPAPKSPPTTPGLAALAPNDGPRVTSALLSEYVQEVFYINPRHAVLAMGGEDNPELDRASFCILLLRSGALVIGTSIVASLENVDENSGRRMAQQDATNRLSDYLGFVMKHTGRGG
jgi:hypothetical protein